MPKYSLTKKDKAYLNLEIEGKTYRLPLANTLKFKEVRKLMKITKLPEDEMLDEMGNFLEKYMGDIVNELLLEDVQEIFALWTKASGGDIATGESSASRD